MKPRNRFCHYTAGIWSQFWAQRTGCGLVVKTHHFTLAAAERAARRYARQLEGPTISDLSWCGGICDGETVRWVDADGTEICREVRQ